MKAEVVNFKATDGTKLDGLIFNYTDVRDKIIISTHGMGSNCFKKREQEIAKLIDNSNVAILAYNNRGVGILTKMKKDVDGEKSYFIAGSANENVIEGYYDIKGAIEFAISLGYKQIYLQGHSLGSTKTGYTYNKLKEENYDKLSYIKGVLLLSLVDIPDAIIDIFGFTEEQADELRRLAIELKESGRGEEFMPKNAFIQPITADEFIRLCIDNDKTNFAKFHDKDYEYELLNGIEVPIFMRWGNNRELIAQDASELVARLNDKIKNNNKDIDYIDGADHSYNGYEEILAKHIVNFVNNN